MKMTPKIKKSIPFKYAYDVRAGNIVAGRYVRLAVDRFFELLNNLQAKGYRLNHSEGMKAIYFAEFFITHTKGPIAGEPLILSPYQQFTIYCLMAFQKQNIKGDWVRVVKTVYEKVARKNGKSAILAFLSLYMECMDGEQSPEIYVGATKEAQAKILWEQAHQFVFKSIKLRKMGFHNTQREIRFPKNMGVFRFLGGDSKTLDGLNPNFSALDEYHGHPTDGVREVLESAMGARSQPLMYIITTAGFNIVSPCKLYEDVCKQILEGQKTDDSTFIMIHELDEEDDWEDSENWVKANPNLGVSISMDYLKTEYEKAKNQPSKVPNFKTKHLNIWVDAPSTWIPSEVWKRNKVAEIPLSKFKEFGSYSALDLSTTIDITAYVALSEPDENKDRYLKAFFFCPLDTIDKRSKEDKAPYRQWVDEGYLIATPGNTVDYDYVEDKIKETYYQYGVKEIQIDRYNASHIAGNLLEAGLDAVFYSQSMASMSLPTKIFEKLVTEGKIKHDGNPVLEWMLAGVIIYTDANGNIKIHKGKSNTNGKKKVDGIVATVMALGASISLDDTSDNSAYNNTDNEIYI